MDIKKSAHPAAVIESSLIFSLLGIVDCMSLVLSHHYAIGTSVTSSIVILAVLFPFTITGIILLYLSSYCCQSILNIITPLELLQLHSIVILAV